MSAYLSNISRRFQSSAARKRAISLPKLRQAEMCAGPRGAGLNLHLQTSEAALCIAKRADVCGGARGPNQPTTHPTNQTNTLPSAPLTYLVFCVRSSRARLNYLLTRRVPRHSNSRLLGIIFAVTGKAITPPPNVSQDIFYAPREETRR